MAQSLDKNPEPQRRIFWDCAVGVGVVSVFASLSLMFQWSEALFKWLRQYEILDLDELMLSLLMLLVCLTWFSWRRWHDMQSQLQVRMQLQTQRDALYAQNRELSQKILSAQEDERRDLARELHDEVAQSCTAIRYEAAFIAKSFDQHIAPIHEAAHEAALRIENQALLMHQMMRKMLKRLRPESIDSMGFDAALRSLCRNWEQQFGLVCECDLAANTSPVINDYAKISLYRVVQEALINVARHAKASSAQVKLLIRHQGLRLIVQDNGIGFDASAPVAGLGLAGIQERIASLQGQVQWLSTSLGACLICDIPLSGGAA